MGFILIYTTASDMKEAKKLAKHLLGKKLVACVNFFKAESSYLWHGKIESGKEIVLILKTDSEKWNKVKLEIEKIHSSDLPCVIRIETQMNAEFLKWIESEIE
jgi:periplasmic divalent cation tolerance protein